MNAWTPRFGVFFVFLRRSTVIVDSNGENMLKYSLLNESTTGAIGYV